MELLKVMFKVNEGLNITENKIDFLDCDIL